MHISTLLSGTHISMWVSCDVKNTVMSLSNQFVSFCFHIGSYIIKIHGFCSSVLFQAPGLSRLRPNLHTGHCQETGVNHPLAHHLGFPFTTVCPSIIPRSAWEARETHCPQMNLPAKFVIIIHTAGRSCNESVDCLVRVRDTQSFHIDNQDFCDIAYQ